MPQLSQFQSLFGKLRNHASCCAYPSKAGRIFVLLIFLLSLVGAPPTSVGAAEAITFTGEELLGKPTDTSITINIVPDETIEYYYEYGTSEGGPYTDETSPVTAVGGQPHEVVITGLNPDTRYYYRMIYDGDGDVNDGDYIERDEHTFHTQRPAGSTFTFTVISDSHAMYNTQYQQAIANVVADHPDFHFDLGDTFMTDSDTNQSQVNQEYLVQRDPLYIGGIGYSSPIFLASGNHENEEGWNLDDTFSIALASIQARKAYYPTPIDEGAGGFYSGNTDPLAAIDEATYGDEYREDYYAWEWGDALFVVFDPFQYTMQNPYGSMAGEGSDDPATGDRWNWTLGLEQYNWLKDTLEGSTAKYKFMFAHHMVGGTQSYVRGGAVPAHMFEWGGYEADGTTWGWDTKRSTWDDDPIRQLMIDNGVSAFFHGHDHQYAYEVRDGIVYLSMPRPSTGLDFNYYSESDQYTERVLASPGHLRVTVTPSQATVDYITSSGTSGAIQHTFTILPNTPSPTHDLTMAVSPDGSGTTTPAVGSHSYAEGTEVTIAATPGLGYEFVDWTGDVADANAATTTVLMDENQSVTANFAVAPTYDLTMAVDPGGSGTTTPGVGTHAYTQNEVVDISASPAAGYQFDSWDGDVADPDAASTTVTMDGNKTVTATFSEYVPGSLTLDGAVSSGTADGVSTINVPHTTGTGTDRLMLVGVSANSYNGAQTISSVTFTPDGGSATALAEVGSVENEAGRLAAIYSLLNPPSGTSGTVAVTFSGSVAYGIIVGAANFAGVSQSDPLDDFVSAVGTEATAISLDVPTDADDLVFDTVFLGAATLPSLTEGAGQTELWDATIDRARGAASSEPATSATTSMSWTASGGATSYFWAIGAVPINPVSSVPHMPSHNIVLSRPTDDSVTVSAIVEQDGDLYFEYGTTSGSYTGQTAASAATAGEPVEAVIGGLDADTQYFYRARFQPTGSSTWATSAEYSFYTQRARGEGFTFTITSDSHLGQTFSGNDPARYEQAMLNVAADDPDFHLDLGDAFIVSDDLGVGSNQTGNQSQVDAVYEGQRPYFGNFSHSAPVFIVIGNHENEEGWNLDDTPFSRALASIIARKEYFPNPIPDAFYSGNEDTLPQVGGDGYREDYYAWEWGDALFVVLDPFQYTMVKPYGAITGSGEDNDETVDEDQWNWTLGQAQFDWFQETLESSTAQYKFVFAHHVVGGLLNVSGTPGAPGYVRGGAEAAPYFEWGGYNAVETPVYPDDWGFDDERTGWGDNPVHELMVDNHVSAFFHGHDHQFVHEEIDGIVYQLVPGAGMTGSGFDLYTGSPYVVSGGNLPNAGHLRVTVSPDETTVEYVRSAISGDTGVTNGEVSHSYTILPNVPTGILGDVNGSGTVNSTDALIILSCDVGMDTSQYCPMNCGDVNASGTVNSTDALIILSYDVGMTVPYSLGEAGCPSSVTPCPGCSP